jgi:hypothetical protein
MGVWNGLLGGPAEVVRDWTRKTDRSIPFPVTSAKYGFSIRGGTLKTGNFRLDAGVPIPLSATSGRDCCKRKQNRYREKPQIPSNCFPKRHSFA